MSRAELLLLVVVLLLLVFWRPGSPLVRTEPIRLLLFVILALLVIGLLVKLLMPLGPS